MIKIRLCRNPHYDLCTKILQIAQKVENFLACQKIQKIFCAFRHAERHRNRRFLAPPETPFPCDFVFAQFTTKIRNARKRKIGNTCEIYFWTPNRGSFRAAETAVPILNIRFIPPMRETFLSSRAKYQSCPTTDGTCSAP